MDKKIQIFQVWLYDNTKWVIKNNNTKTEYVSVIPLSKWNDKEGFNYLGIDRTELLRAGEIIYENVDNYLLYNYKDEDKNTNKKKHSHYYKDVRHLDYIDIYRFCDLFIENDPSGALHHAIKKLAACGRRGAGKDELKDLKEAADTINRKIEMLEEDMLKNK